MLKNSVVCLYFAVMAVNFWNVKCMSDEEKKAVLETLTPIVEGCASDYGLTNEDFKKHENIDDDNFLPFKKCLLQKLEIMDETGKYNSDAMSKSIVDYTGDKEQAKKFKEQFDSCFEKNGNNDGDDEASQMKRVEVMFKCFKEMEE